ncbi:MULTISPECIES: hypothetical protein [Aquimarina]|uniref:hypothetical protein n=1 Tax=Aquimarina TaxID=290174 RepID=UPI00041DBEF7|nr:MULTISPECIES: hypothetical protein [Aquimarina]
MKKSILELGKTLNKSAQKEINGGRAFFDCSDLCRIREEDRQYHIALQMELYGADFSHCTCSGHSC